MYILLLSVEENWGSSQKEMGACRLEQQVRCNNYVMTVNTTTNRYVINVTCFDMTSGTANCVEPGMA